jgi:putative phage-type endonuclease
MEEFIRNNPTIITEPDFDEIFEENINDLIEAHFDSDIFYTEEAEDEIANIIDQVKTDFFKDFMPIRSYPSSIILEEPNYSFLEKQINILKAKPQPVQRTKEWYEFRHNLITASSAHKAFDSQSTKNQLIYEKCQSNITSLEPDTIDCNSDTKVIQMQSSFPVQMVNVNTTLHHGQKYEPLSVMIYEDMYKTKVDDFGCIQHETYSFLGASPDGINVDQNSNLYGRMLEIKNIVNREITGIPKKEYWIQTQLQMEVCDLDECDFLETKFTEYQNFSEFCNDGQEKTLKDEFKGIIMYFSTKEGRPFYLYKPLELTDYDEIDNWEEKMIEKYESEQHNMLWIKNHYWKLEKLSCVLILRNRKWFQDNIAQLEKVWNIILKERETGYEHRAPNKRVKKETVNNNEFQGCFINIVKLQ